jgi:hypothetical protein
VRSEGVAFGQLDRDLLGKVAVESPIDINPGEFLELGLRRFLEFACLAREVRPFSIGPTR